MQFHSSCVKAANLPLADFFCGQASCVAPAADTNVARVDGADAELDGEDGDEDAAASTVSCTFQILLNLRSSSYAVHCRDTKGAARGAAAAARSELSCLGGALEKFSQSSIVDTIKWEAPNFSKYAWGGP
jgi:hypothetical protein